MFWVKVLVGLYVLTNCVAMSVKTVKMDYGDVYDCIDFYKQPAFDHPFLKNHNFHFDMKPSNINEKEKIETKRRRINGIHSVSLKGVGCPRGTVPIKRTTKEEVTRLKAFNEMFDSNQHLQTESEPGLHYAGADMGAKKDVVEKIGGASGQFTLYQTPLVNQLQFSSGLIKVSNGTDFIKAGWTVNPTLYGDNRCRFFVYLHTRDQHCFDTKCPGFVHVNSDIPLGYVFPEVSKSGGKLVEAKFSIVRDPSNGNWWLKLGDDDKNIGFWPASIFTDLANNADRIYWGGELFSVPNTRSCPLGNGMQVLVDDPRLYAYVRTMSVVDADSQKDTRVGREPQITTDLNGFFVDRNYITETDPYWAQTIMFGGPGKVLGD